MSTRARGRASAKSEGTTAAGRSGARSRAPEAPSRPPHESTMRDLIKDQPPKEGQFEDVADHNKAADASSAAAADSSIAASPIEGKPSNIERPPAHAHLNIPRDDESDSSSINPISPQYSPPNSKLNPSAPVFSPTHSLSPPSTTTSKLNPSTPEFSPSAVNGTGNRGSVNQTQTHHSSPSTFLSTALRSILNPRSTEFIPKTISPVFVASTNTSSSMSSSLNASAPAFVPHGPLPSGMQNGKIGDDMEEPILGSTSMPPEEDDDEGEPLLFTTKDILSGVTFPVTLAGDEDEVMLKATAEVLIKTTIYPGSFDRGRTKLENMVKAWLPSEEVLSNLAEMLVHWGISEPSLRLSVSRICQALCEMEQLCVAFKRQMLSRLRVWFDKQSSLDSEKLINYSLFFAELFSRIRTSHKEEVPVRVLGKAVLELLALLLEKSDERCVISACHILKLTGPLLASLPSENETKLKGVVVTLENLSASRSPPLSQKCVEIVRRVLELWACGWGQPARPLTSTPLGQHVTGGGEGGEALLGSEVVVGAAEVPSEANVFQMPVSNPEEWNEFLDDDNQLIEERGQPTTESFVMEKGEGGEGEEELDAEMEREFEFFVQDLEEHLLNVGEMDPEQLQEEQQQ